MSGFHRFYCRFVAIGWPLGVVADNFASMNPIAKWVLIANMLFGRLEVFTLLVLFTPTFWRE